MNGGNKVFDYQVDEINNSNYNSGILSNIFITLIFTFEVPISQFKT